jgi:hypothetical protein
MYRVISVCGFALLSLYSISAAAVEALSTEELISHCTVYERDSQGEDGIFCVRYIQGFIDGAIVTDERVTYNVAAEFDEDESFSERAFRTRLGRSMERFGPSFYAEFCLGEPVPLKSVVELVIADLLSLDETAERELARDVVYATLRREFPCSPGDAG